MTTRQADRPRVHRPPWEKIHNLLWEARLNVSTRGVAEVDHPDSSHYATENYRAVWNTLRRLEISPQDTFIDIGCGKGRVVCCAARLGPAKAIGIDLSAELCAVARKNTERVRGARSPMVIQEAYADEFDYRDVTVCYLFSPFGATTLDRVLTKIREDTTGHAVRMAFLNAAPEQKAVLDGHSWLECYDSWTPGTHGLHHLLAFYRTR